MPTPRELLLPVLRMEASFELSTLDAEKRTVDVRWYTGARVQRFSFFDGPYTLAFSMDPKAVHLDRLNAGAPFKGGHAHNSDLDAVIGVVEKAWLEDDGGHARVKIAADRPDILARLQDGILRNVSMESEVHKIEDVTEKGAKEKAFLATEWTPHAIALVAAGADPDAQALSSAEKFRCELIQLADHGEPKETKMSDTTDTTGTVEQPKPGSSAQDREAAELLAMKEDARKVEEHIGRDKERATQIRKAADYYELDQIWSQDMIRSGFSIDRVLELAVEERNKRKPKPPNDRGAANDTGTIGWRFQQMTDALAARATNQECPAPAVQYARASMVEMALECLSWKGLASGLDVRFNASRIVELALTSSDFPNLLANLASKILLPDYAHATPTYRILSERMDLPDFKQASVLKVGDFPLPLLVGEGAEIQLGQFAEAKDTFQLLTYGRRLTFSFQAIINDDLGALTRVMRATAARLADFENALWFTALVSAAGAGPTLGDGGALFNATAVTTLGGHANLTSGGTAIDETSIGVGRAMMRRQQSTGGGPGIDGLKLNVIPRFILTSPEKETLARKYTTLIGPNVAPSSQNPWAGTLEPLADANLSSANPWYLFASPAQFPVSVWGTLRGTNGPDIVTRQGFETLGVEMRLAHHFGIGWIDWKGSYRNAGA